MNASAPKLRLVQPQCPFPAVHRGECLGAECRYWIGGPTRCALTAIERNGAMTPTEIAKELGTPLREVEWNFFRALRRRWIKRQLREWMGTEEARGVHALAALQQENGEEADCGE